MHSKKSLRFAVFLLTAVAAFACNLTVLSAYQAWLGGVEAWQWTDWLTLIAFLPFGGFGLALAGTAVFLGMPLRNPRVTFEVFPARATPGTRIEVAWKLDGNLGLVKSLGIILEGREEAWRSTRFGRIGRSKVFRRVPVFRTTEQDRIKSGGAAFSLPDDLVPSFHGASNRLAWYVCIHSGVGRWPHMRQELAFTVEPPGRGGLGGGG